MQENALVTMLPRKEVEYDGTRWRQDCTHLKKKKKGLEPLGSGLTLSLSVILWRPPPGVKREMVGPSLGSLLNSQNSSLRCFPPAKGSLWSVLKLPKLTRLASRQVSCTGFHVAELKEALNSDKYQSPATPRPPRGAGSSFQAKVWRPPIPEVPPPAWVRPASLSASATKRLPDQHRQRRSLLVTSSEEWTTLGTKPLFTPSQPSWMVMSPDRTRAKMSLVSSVKACSTLMASRADVST